MSILGRFLYSLNTLRREGWAAEYHRSVSRPRIWDLPPQPCAPSDAYPSVHVVCTANYIDLTAWMLFSFFTTTNRSWDVWIHDDGTLLQEHRQRLMTRFPRIRIIDLIDKLPLGRTYLQAHKTGISDGLQPWQIVKAIDTFLLAPRDRFILLDPDILFFRKPEFILNWCTDYSNSAWFNEDIQEPSPYSAESSWKTFGFPIWSCVNSGLCLLPKSILDLDLIAQVLEDPVFQASNSWRKEQTLIAILASKINQGGLLPKSYEITLCPRRGSDSVARHYLGAVRHHFWGEGVAWWTKTDALK